MGDTLPRVPYTPTQHVEVSLCAKLARFRSNTAQNAASGTLRYAWEEARMRLVRNTFCTLLFTVAAFAQSDRGTITGSVIDPAAAVVPGAKVSAKNLDNGATFETTTTDTGNFTLASLPAGKYELNVEASGFKKATHENVEVAVAQTVRVDTSLQVGASTESVTVTAEAALLKTENGEQSMVIKGDKVNDLPLNFGGGGSAGGGIRNWLSFNRLGHQLCHQFHRLRLCGFAI